MPAVCLQDVLLSDEPNSTPISTQSFIGIIVAISGNILISLALNCQKLAHLRLDRELEGASAPERKSTDAGQKPPNNGQSPSVGISSAEAEPLLNQTPAAEIAYGGAERTTSPVLSLNLKARAPKLGHRLSSASIRHSPRASPAILEEGVQAINLAITANESPRAETPDGGRSLHEEGDHDAAEGGEARYLKSKLWWFGFALMNIGEIGNFLSYGFAPASVVAPLGAFALIANCVFAPLILHERLHRNDFFGVILAIFGAATVVASSKQSSPHWRPPRLIEAISQQAFIIYVIIMCVLACLLVIASDRKWGRRFVLIDVGICAVFGGFTVLSTKAISTLVSVEWFDTFKEWITYPLLLVLLGTGVGQIKYLNRALMKFDAKQVIPTQFVLFNLSAIVGSAILYRDFNKVNFHQFVTFLYGCAATFAGVYLLTTSKVDDGQEGMGQSEEGQRQLRLAAIPEEDQRLEGGGVQAGPIKILKRKRSSAGIGLSPGQYLLLVAPALAGSATPSNVRSRSLERRASVASRARSPERPASLNQR